METQFADYKTSKMIKSLGFNEDCLMVYCVYGTSGSDKIHLWTSQIIFEKNLSNNTDSTNEEYCTAPIWLQIKEWLWNKFGIAIRHEWLSSFYSAIEEKGEIKKGGLTPHRSPVTAEIEGIKNAVESLYSKMTVTVTPINTKTNGI